jgi:hypothetical protein
LNRISSLYIGCTLTFSIFLAGCAGPKYTLDTSQISAVEILNSIEAEQKKLHSFESTSRISVDSPEFSGTFFADILYLEPDSLLLSATGPFGIHAGKIFIGRERFIFHNQIDNRFYNGSVEEFRDRSFFQFPLNLSELMYVFAGKEQLSALKIKNYSTSDGQFYIEAAKANMNYQIWVDHMSGRINKLIALLEDETVYIKEYGDFLKQDGMYFPRKISMTRPGRTQAVSIYHTKISINSDPDKSRFKVEISDQAEQIDYLNYNGK